MSMTGGDRWGLSSRDAEAPEPATHSTEQVRGQPGTDTEHYKLMSSGRIKPDEPQTPGSDSQFLLAFDRSKRSGRATPHHRRGAGLGVESRSDRLLMENARSAYCFTHRDTGCRWSRSPPLAIEEGPSSCGSTGAGGISDRSARRRRLQRFLFCPIRTGGASTRRPPDRRQDLRGFRLWRSESQNSIPPSALSGSTMSTTTSGSNWDRLNSRSPIRTSTEKYGMRSHRSEFRSRSERDTAPRQPRSSGSTRSIPRPSNRLSVGTRHSSSCPSRRRRPPGGPSWFEPYRVDGNYTFESGGWEGRSIVERWKRTIWFIHLPPTASSESSARRHRGHDPSRRRRPDRAGRPRGRRMI